MSNDFERVKTMYREGFEKFGDSTEALLTPKGRQEERFGLLAEYLSSGDRILDFGCGLGYLYEYLQQHTTVDFTYHGVDLSEEFITTCDSKFANDPNCSFELIDPESIPSDKFDIVFCSGVFNINYSSNRESHIEYVYGKLEELFARTERLLVTDFLSPNVDYQQEDSFHVEYGSLLDFCQTKLSRRWLLRHDVLPYEVTLLVFSHDSIARPDNTYGE